MPLFSCEHGNSFVDCQEPSCVDRRHRMEHEAPEDRARRVQGYYGPPIIIHESDLE